MAIHTDYVSNGIAPVLRPLSPENRTKMAIDMEVNEDEQEVKHIKTWRDEIISLKSEYQEPIAVLVRGNDEFVHLGDIQMIEGHQGSKKTFLVSAMIAGTLGASPDNSLGFEFSPDRLPDGADGKVLYIDTEQNPANTYRVKRRVHRLANLDENNDNDKFIAINQRGDTIDERLKFTLDAIKDIRPTICFIDNLKDLGGDFNDPSASYNLVSKMMWATAEYNCAIVCVIHQNFSGDKAKGHIGSALYEKVTLCISLEVDDPNGDSITRVSMGKKSRNKRPEDFAFIVDDKGLPRLTTPPVKSAKSDNVRKFLQDVIKPDEIVSAGELKRVLSRELCVSERTAGRYIAEAERTGILTHFGTGQRDSRYQLSIFDVSKDDENNEYDNDRYL